MSACHSDDVLWSCVPDFKSSHGAEQSTTLAGNRAIITDARKWVCSRKSVAAGVSSMSSAKWLQAIKFMLLWYFSATGRQSDTWYSFALTSHCSVAEIKHLNQNLNKIINLSARVKWNGKWKAMMEKGPERGKVTGLQTYFSLCGPLKLAGPRLNCATAEITPQCRLRGLVLLSCMRETAVPRNTAATKATGQEGTVRLRFVAQTHGVCFCLKMERVKLKAGLSCNCTWMCPLPTALTPALAL